MRVLVALVCIGVLLVLLHLAASVVTPFLLGTTLAIAFQPLAVALARRGLPPVVAAILTTLVVLGVVAAAGVLIYLAVSDLAAQLPVYQERIEVVREDLADWLRERNMDDSARAVSRFDASEPINEFLSSSLLQVGTFVERLFFVLIITAFIQMEGAIYRRKLLAMFRSARPVHWLVQALREVQRYLVVKLIVSLVNGVLLGTWCWIWGVDSPLMWGVLAFILNFIPFIGSTIAAIPPIALSLMTDGVPTAAVVGAGYLVVNLLVDTVAEPRILGRTLGLSPLVVLLSMLTWGFVLGPVGAILAVPLTMTAKILFEHDEDLAKIAVFLGDGSALPTPRPAG
jgi:AI-2 transport protein TqsA